jgi:L-alanine-DL-glutamate epimerase-like enolase superfamily enzyme
MKIERIEIIPFVMPYKDVGVTTSLGSHTSMRNVLLAIHSDEGVTGWGETAPLPAYSGETQESIIGTLEKYICPMLLNKDPRQINLLLQEMDRILWGQHFAKCAVDFALHDLLAKYLKIPLYQLLGGKCRSDFPLAWTLGWKSVKDTVDQALEAVEKGFKAIKVKVGNPDWKMDVERVRQVRKTLGEDIPIRVDANQGYTVSEAIRVIRLMESCNLQLVEQPVARWDLNGMRHVRDSIPFPVLADESAASPEDVIKIAEYQAADIVNIKPQKLGGLCKSRQVASIASAANIQVFASARICSSIGVAAATHFYVAIPNAGFEGEFADGLFMAEEDFAVDPIQVINGFVQVPEANGIGVKVNQNVLKRYTLNIIVLKS